MENLGRRAFAEFVGTFWLVFGGTGSAVFAAIFVTSSHVPVGIGFAGVALAFGLTVLTMAYALGHISGGHFNPAVTLGLWAAKRFPARDIAPYAIAQVAGAVAASAVILAIVSGHPGFALQPNGLAANGYGEHSPGGFGAVSGFVAEFVLTAGFLVVILGSTDIRAPKGFAPIAIGLALTLIHLVSIPITNTSVNPARSTGPALLVGGWAIGQLWLFWLAPIAGALVAGYGYRALSGETIPSIADELAISKLKPATP
jgi:aquaporin Z